MSERASILLLTAIVVGGAAEIVGLHRQLRSLERALPAAPAEEPAPARHLRLVPTP